MVTINSANYSPTNHAIQVGGTNGALTSLSLGSTGQALQSGGGSADPAFSTATYPSTATGTGKILRADGTNWSASTATYPNTAGSSTNVLTSDGTNWTSAAPSGGYSGMLQITNFGGFNPADSTTYYLVNASGLNTLSNGAKSRFQITRTATITACYALVTVQGVLGSSENVTLQIFVNGSSSTNVSTTWQWTATSNNISNTGLSISVSAGDYVQVRYTTPAWVTNPTTCNINVMVLMT